MMGEFYMGTLVDSVISQGMLLSKKVGAKIITEISDTIKALRLKGDQARLQQVLAALLSCAISHARGASTRENPWVDMKVSLRRHRLDDAHMMDFDFRYVFEFSTLNLMYR
jgi:phytochrome B